jgi:hypothetical protein
VSRTLSLLLPLLVIGTLLYFVLRDTPGQTPLDEPSEEGLEAPAEPGAPPTGEEEVPPLPAEVTEPASANDVPRLLPPDVLIEDARDALAGRGDEGDLAAAHAAIAKRLRDNGRVGQSLERAIQRERDPLVRAFAFTALGPAATSVLSARLLRFLKSLAGPRHPDIEKIALLAASLASPGGTDVTLEDIGALNTRIGGGSIAPEIRRAVVQYVFGSGPKSLDLPQLTMIIRASLQHDQEIAWSLITTRGTWSPWIDGLGSSTRQEIRTAVLGVNGLDEDLRAYFEALD